MRANVEKTCQRIISLGPLRLALFMLIAILILPMQSVEAHGGDISESGFSSDNLFRAHASLLDVTTEFDFRDRCNGTSPCGTSGCLLWNLPPEPILVGGSTLFDGCLSEALQSWIAVTDGSTGACAGAACTKTFYTADATQGVENYTEAFVADFKDSLGNIPATNVKLRIKPNPTASPGGGDTFFNLSLFNVAGSLVRYIELGSVPCTGTANTEFTPAVAFTRTSFNKAVLSVDTRACTIGGSQVLVYGLVQYAIWNKDNKDDSVTHTKSALEYGDWLIAREGASGTNSVVNISTITNASFPVPPGISYVYLSSFCDDIQGCQSVGGGAFEALWPQSWTIGASSCFSGTTTTFLGWSANNGGDKGLSVWEIDNKCSSVALIRYQGRALSAQSAFLFSNMRLFFANAYPAGEDVLNPLVGRCFGCAVIGQFSNLSVSYGINRAPFTTFSEESSINLHSNFDLSNITQVIAPQGCTTTMVTCSFTLTLNPEQYFGQSIYVVLGALNATVVPELCAADTKIRINGEARPIAWTRGIATNDALGLMRLCAWLVVDFASDLDVARDINGNNRYWDNSRVAFSYSVTMPSANWPASAKAPNGISSNGYDLKAPQVFRGRFSERLQCISDHAACFGNIDTFDPLTSPIRYNFFTNDQTNTSNVFLLANVTIEDSDTTNLIKTNATGKANLTIVNSFPNFIFSKSGYNTAYLNLTNVSVPTVNIQVQMSRNALERFQITDCGYTLANTLNCTIVFTGDASAISGGICNVIDANTLTCPGSARTVQAPLWKFACSQDHSASIPTHIREVNFTESVSGFAFTIRQPSDFTGPLSQTFCTGAQLRGQFQAVPTDVRFEFTSPGYRSLQWNADDLTAQDYVVYTFFKKGSGAATNVNITYTNTTAVIQNFSFPATVVIIKDLDTASASILDRPLSFSEGLVALGNTLGFADSAGKVLFGLLIVTAVTILCLLLEAPGFVTIFAMVATFMGTAFVGFYPGWLIFILVVVVVVGGYLIFVRANPSQDG